MNNKKRNNNMLMLGVFAAISGALIFMAVTRQANTVQDMGDRLFREVMAIDLVNEYPDDPVQVLEIYNQTDILLSGNMPPNFTDDDVVAVIELQRMLLHSQLLAINPIEDHVAGYKEKMAYLEETGLRLMQVNTETPRFSDDARVCTIGAIQFWTNRVRINLIFNLQRDGTDGKWRIIGWEVNEQNMQTEAQEGEQ